MLMYIYKYVCCCWNIFYKHNITVMASLLISDVQGNVRALKYTLDHPLIFRDHDVRLDIQQKPYEPQAKVPSA